MADEIGSVGGLRPQDVALCTLLRALGTPQQARMLPLNGELAELYLLMTLVYVLM